MKAIGNTRALKPVASQCLWTVIFRFFLVSVHVCLAHMTMAARYVIWLQGRIATLVRQPSRIAELKALEILREL